MESFANGLAVIEGVVLLAAVTERNVEVSVRSEVKITSIMIVGEVLLIEEDSFSRRRGRWRAGRNSLEAGEALVGSSVRDHTSVDEEISVHLKIRMKGQAEQPLLATGRELRRQVHVQRFRGAGCADVGHDLDAPAF